MRPRLQHLRILAEVLAVLGVVLVGINDILNGAEQNGFVNFIQCHNIFEHDEAISL